MLNHFIKAHRRLARVALAGFALFSVLTALAPCVIAASCADPGLAGSVQCCDHNGQAVQKNPCHPAVKADCQRIDQSRLDSSALMDTNSLYTFVLLQTLAPTTQAVNLHRTRQLARNAAAAPHPPLNLKHAILLI